MKLVNIYHFEVVEVPKNHTQIYFIINLPIIPAVLGSSGLTDFKELFDECNFNSERRNVYFNRFLFK